MNIIYVYIHNTCIYIIIHQNVQPTQKGVVEVAKVLSKRYRLI